MSAAFKPLATERLLLRPLTPADAPALHRLLNDWAVVRNLARVPFPYSRELADDWIASTAKRAQDGTLLHLGIAGPDAGSDLVGAIGLDLDLDTKEGDLGYWVGRPFWGHGVATEAVRRLTRWALANLDLDRLTAQVAIDNPASAAVLRRAGFRETGRSEGAFLARGGKHPTLTFEATRNDLSPTPQAATPQPAPATATPTGKPLILVAAVGLIDTDTRVLLARRPEGKPMAGLWEFPGGKVEPGETPEAALIRELREELGIDVAANCLAAFTFASHAYDTFHLLMPLFLCRRWSGQVEPREGQTLAWVPPRKLADYPMPPADKPLIPLLRDFL